MSTPSQTIWQAKHYKNAVWTITRMFFCGQNGLMMFYDMLLIFWESLATNSLKATIKGCAWLLKPIHVNDQHTILFTAVIHSISRLTEFVAIWMVFKGRPKKAWCSTQGRNAIFSLLKTHEVRLKTLPPSRRGATSVLHGNFQRIASLPANSPKYRKDRTRRHNSQPSQCSVVWVCFEFWQLQWQSILILCFKYRYPSCRQCCSHESTRQEACWKGENLRRNPCKSYAFDSVVLCDVLSDQG